MFGLQVEDELRGCLHDLVRKVEDESHLIKFEILLCSMFVLSHMLQKHNEFTHR